MINEHRRENSVRRGGHENTFSIDRVSIDDADNDYSSIQLSDENNDPASLFDREWAHCLIRQTINDLQSEYADKGKQEWFEKLSPMLTSTESSPRSRQQIAKELGLSATALKVAIHRLRASYRQRLLGAVAQTVENPEDCGRERQWLVEALGKS